MIKIKRFTAIILLIPILGFSLIFSALADIASDIQVAVANNQDLGALTAELLAGTSDEDKALVAQQIISAAEAAGADDAQVSAIGESIGSVAASLSSSNPSAAGALGDVVTSSSNSALSEGFSQGSDDNSDQQSSTQGDTSNGQDTGSSETSGGNDCSLSCE